jgi:hypothetical protein
MVRKSSACDLKLPNEVEPSEEDMRDSDEARAHAKQVIHPTTVKERLLRILIHSLTGTKRA